MNVVATTCWWPLYSSSKKGFNCSVLRTRHSHLCDVLPTVLLSVIQRRKVESSHHNSVLLGRERICSWIWTLNNHFPCSRIIKACLLYTHPSVVLYFHFIIQHAFLWVTFPYGVRVQWVLILQSFFSMCMLGCQESQECTVELVSTFPSPSLGTLSWNHGAPAAGSCRVLC